MPLLPAAHAFYTCESLLLGLFKMENTLLCWDTCCYMGRNRFYGTFLRGLHMVKWRMFSASAAGDRHKWRKDVINSRG